MKREERLAQDGVEDPILFYGKNHPHWDGFSNFTYHSLWLPHPFTQRYVEYQTAEHRYQAMKAQNEGDHDFVLEQNGPGAAKGAGRAIPLREAWGDDYGQLCYLVMFEVVMTKVLQHPEITLLLQTTGTRRIYEDSPKDNIWGWRKGNNYNGKNLLGKCYMQVRTLLLEV